MCKKPYLLGVQKYPPDQSPPDPAAETADFSRRDSRISSRMRLNPNQKVTSAELATSPAVTPNSFLTAIAQFARQAYAKTTPAQRWPVFVGFREVGPPEIHLMPVPSGWVLDPEPGRILRAIRQNEGFDRVALIYPVNYRLDAPGTEATEGLLLVTQTRAQPELSALLPIPGRVGAPDRYGSLIHHDAHHHLVLGAG